MQHAPVTHWHVIWENIFIQITSFPFQYNMVNLQMDARYEVFFVSIKYSKFPKAVIAVVNTLSWYIGLLYKGNGL